MLRTPTPGRRIGRISMSRSDVWLAALVFTLVIVSVVGIAAMKQRQSDPFKLDFATVPDGSVPPRSNGFELSAVGGERNEYGLRVINGRLCHGSPLGDDAASYLETSLKEPVTRIGVTATFPAYSGSVALVVWQSSLAKSGGRIPNAGIHLVFGANQWNFNQWHFGVWQEDQGEAILASGTFTSNGFNTPHTFEAIRHGDTAVVMLPDGQSHTISDPRIGAWTGTFPTWELYEFKPGLVPASINSIWAA